MREQRIFKHAVRYFSFSAAKLTNEMACRLLSITLYPVVVLAAHDGLFHGHTPLPSQPDDSHCHCCLFTWPSQDVGLNDQRPVYQQYIDSDFFC